MASPLIETKLHVPRPRRALVPRRRLSDLLDRGRAAKLILLSAPPGFGKTTLVADWLAAAPPGHRSAWVSLDASDRDPASFWTSVLAALRVVMPGVGADALTLLDDAHPPPIESVLATLLNELARETIDLTLVLDDYHEVDGPDIGAGMAFVLEHLPPGTRVVLTARADPGLPLARLRARGDLIEIRARDLRFTGAEATAYLNEAMALDLAPGAIDALEDRTEGWIAALQLAALSIKGRDEPAAFIEGFAGDDRHVVDYLVEEVLHRQSERTRTFLLQTSILDRMTGSLCDAVTGQTGGASALEGLDRANLFLVPLDDRRRWYRYHRLFADLLRARLRDEQPGGVPDLHRRASAWFEQDGDVPEAIRHALEARDVEHAAALIERAIPDARSKRREAAMEAWLDALPDAILARHPVLGVHLAGVLLLRGQLDAVESRLRQAERWLDAPSDAFVVVDEPGFGRLPAAIAIYRAALAQVRGDLAGTVAHARRAHALAGANDDMGRGGASGFLALAAWRTGDLEAAAAHWADAMANLERAGFLPDATGTAVALADIRVAQGRLRDAMRTYEHALRLATPEEAPAVRGAADLHVGLGEVLLERGDLEAARHQLRRSRDLGAHHGLPQNAHRWPIAMARLREAEGDITGALSLLAEAERLFVPGFFPNVRPIAATRARLLIRQGRLPEAAAWAQERGLTGDDELDYLREYEHLTLARLLLAQSAPSATGFIDRLFAAARSGGRMGSALELLVLQAVAGSSGGDRRRALAPLERALALAEPEGFVRVFVDEGAPVSSLLQEAARGGHASAFLSRLLAAFAGPADRPSASPGLIEPLSERELEVLGLLRSDLDGPEIARQLFVSVNTVRTHTRNVYAKLGVTNRRAAVRRADELGLRTRR